MSGHSKWATIKHAKAITDARRGSLFTKLTKEIIVAARLGGGDPESNFRLRIAIQKARDSNMPTDNIQRAIKRGTGEGGAHDQMAEVIYEGYAPGGTAILLQAVTDNRNRTSSEVRAVFTKSGGSLGEAGSVAWQFQQKGVITVEAAGEQAEELALLAIDAGADDFESFDSSLQIYATPDKLEQVRKALAEREADIKSLELSMVPKSTMPLDEDTAYKTLKLLDRLEELDDVQRVFSNADFPDSVLEQYGKEG